MAEVTICEIPLENGTECGEEFLTDWAWREHYWQDHPDDPWTTPKEQPDGA